MIRLMLLAALAWPALAAAQTPAPDLAKARKIATEVCAACHGTDGNSPTAVNPSLAGQHADYITQQLAHFKSGVRANAVMQGMSAALTPEDMHALGVYFSQQKPKGLAARDAGLVKVGQALWRGGDLASGLPACSACHGPSGAGIPKNYPRVAGQHAEYTYAQLKAFASGERGMDKGGKDANGRIMHGVAKNMSDAHMKAVAEYAAGLR
jgi:cytochrome c553